jgi:hypothetical protein
MRRINMQIRPIRTESDHNSAVARSAELIGAMPESADATARPLSECLHSADSAKGRKRLKTYLESQPLPHYGGHPEKGLLIRVDKDGRRTVGRFVNRQFQPAKSPRKAASHRSARHEPEGESHL